MVIVADESDIVLRNNESSPFYLPFFYTPILKTAGSPALVYQGRLMLV